MRQERIILTEGNPAIREAGIMVFGHYHQKIPAGRIAREHHGSCYEICYLESGVQPYCLFPGTEENGETEVYELHGGEVFITRPFQFHSTGQEMQRRGSLYWIQLDRDCPQLLLQSPPQSEILKQALSRIQGPVLSVPREVSRYLTDAFRVLREAGGENMLRGCCLLSLFLLELSRLRRGTEEEGNAWGEVKAFIQDNLTAPALSLNAVAAHMHYSRSYTATLFKKHVGMTVHEYILMQKIEYACELLERYSITDVAGLLNFSSAQHFSKVFREQRGLSPSAYERTRERERRGS